MTLFPIPRSWAWTTLGEIADVAGGVTKDSKKQSDPNLPMVPYLRVANVQRGYLDLANISTIRVPESTIEKLRLMPGDVLLNEGGDRDKLGRGWVWQGQIPNCIHQNHVFRARIIDGVLHPKLLALFANECGRDWFERQASQTVNLASISLSKIKQLPVPVPPPSEQRRIVATLDDHLSRLEAAASGVQRAVRRTVSLEENLLHSAVTGCLVTRRSERPTDWPSEIYAKRSKLVRKGNEAAAPAKIPGYRLPTGWGVASLDALSYASGYGTSAKCGYNAGGTAVLRIPNVQRGEVVLDDLKSAVDPTLDLSSLYLTPGDILFIRTNGSRDLIGRIAVVREKMDIAFASYLIRFRLVPEGIPADWIRLVVNSPLWRRYLEAKAASSAGQHNLSTRVLAPLAIPVPPPEELADIQSAVEQFFTMTKVCRRTSQSLLRRSVALRRALLSESFAGRLVSQDPEDEPASVLLERIRRERAAQPRPRRRTASVSQEEALL